MEKNKFILTDENGNQTVYDVLFTFDSEETGKSYIAYTDNSKDEAGNVQVYASIYHPENENSKFTAEFENTSNKDFEGKEVNIVFLNSEGQEYYRLPSVYIPKVRQGETVPFVTGTSSDIINAYNYTIQ